MEYANLRDFLIGEMRKRGLGGARNFARFVGVSHPTILRAINDENPSVPTAPTIRKIAKATGVDAVLLLAIASADASDADIDIDARILAQQIKQLDPDERRVIANFIRGALSDKARN